MNISSRERGQALVEVLVFAAALVPLLLAVPLIAKYQDIRHAAVAASRTAAFECSVRPEHCTHEDVQTSIAADLRRRHFARHDRDLMSADGMADDAAAEQRNGFWVDRRGAALLSKPSDVVLSTDMGESDAAGGAWNRAARGGRGAAAVADLAGPSRFGFEPAAGLITTGVRAHVSLNRTLAQWLHRPEGLQLALSGKTAVLVDPWNASSGAGAEQRSLLSRVEQGRRLPDAGASFSAAWGAAPADALGSPAGGSAEEAVDLLYLPIRSLITNPLLAPLEPRGTLFRYHEIDVERVPADRIGEP
jgi:hypothetical protein